MPRTTRLATALAVNAGLVVAQVVAGVLAHSSGLLSDAGHNLTDVAALGLSWATVRWALRPPSEQRSFGNHRGTILAALVNSAVLAVVTAAVAVLAVVRLVHPRPVDGALVVVVAALAVVVNAAAALVVHDGSRDLTMRATLLHLAADMLASLAVLAAGLVILVTGGGAWDRLDPLAALVVAALIVVEAVRLSRSSVDVLLESTPADLDLGTLRRSITAVGGVGEVHDLHVWSLSSEVRALSAHLVLTGHPSLEQAQAVGGRVRQAIATPYDIAHTTFELECERCVDGAGDPCEMGDGRPLGRVVDGARPV